MPRLSKKMRKSRKGKKDSRKIMNSEESHLANLIVNNYNKLNKSEPKFLKEIMNNSIKFSNLMKNMSKYPKLHKLYKKLSPKQSQKGGSGSGNGNNTQGPTSADIMVGFLMVFGIMSFIISYVKTSKTNSQKRAEIDAMERQEKDSVISHYKNKSDSLDRRDLETLLEEVAKRAFWRRVNAGLESADMKEHYFGKNSSSNNDENSGSRSN
tara:strand:- start:77 stop:706 length:630 start_codon:yes stop_codon:yes gene_type:complete